MKITINYSIDFNDVFSQMARIFVTKMVDSDGLKWTQLDRAGLGFGHNLDTVWSFLWVRGLPEVWLMGAVMKLNFSTL